MNLGLMLSLMSEYLKVSYNVLYPNHTSQLLWGLPKFESLTAEEQELYNDDRDEYNLAAWKGIKGLHFTKSGTKGQTWVPLIEKAYAKLHGNYESMTGGYSAQAIEDFTGLYRKLNPTSLRWAIRKDLEKVKHNYNDSKYTVRTTTTSPTSIVKKKNRDSATSNTSTSMSWQPEKPSLSQPWLIVAPSTEPSSPTAEDERSESKNKETSKKKGKDWNGTGKDKDDDALYLGLHVYTKNNVVVMIHGWLKYEA
ncbi:hypothetical protein BYT27DRAFT_7263729 [Phlegmacium glaucopus]|nr:hypothetical protein BYT27DRAFT_7263729 [Phlegmacium glaucopus]